jgi:hypothetical protein
MLSEAPSCGDLGVCRMAFVRAGMGFPTVSGHTQGRGSWQGQSGLPSLVRWKSRQSLRHRQILTQAELPVVWKEPGEP